MPFVTNNSQQTALSKAIGLDEIGEEDGGVGFREKVSAAFRIENTIGSVLSQNGNLPDSAATNPNFNPIDHLTEDEKLDARFLSNAIMADNTDEVEAVRSQWAREQSDREKLETGGFLPMAIAAIADPINLIPVGGTAYKTYKGGSSILSAGLVTSGAAAGATAATEAGLHYSQIQRTFGESAINVTAASLLGGVLGAAPVAVRNALTDAGHNADNALKDIEQSFSPEQVLADGGNPAMAPDLHSVGAAEVMTDVNVRGNLAKAMTKFIGFDPLSRTITSDAKQTRITSAELAENPIEMDRPLGTSVESAIKVHDGKMFAAIDGHLKIFEEYKQGGGALARREFNEEVGKAVRNGSDDPIIQKAADNWDTNLYEPIKGLAIKAKILPEDVQISTAKNYLNRLWNKNKIAEGLPRFVDTTARWLSTRNPDLELVEAKDLARQIASRIMSTPDGRLPYDYQIGENSPKIKKATGLKGPFKSRTFDIPDNIVEDFLENDIELLGARYLKNTAPDIELVNKFGDVNMEAEIKAIDDEWIERIDKEQSPSKRLKLKKERDRDIKNIAAMRDRLRGTFATPDFDNPWVRTGRVMRDLNYMRLLGGVVASSIPDVARIIMAEGMANTFRFGLKPLITNLRSFKVAANEAKLYGIGTDALMGGRAEIIADIADYAAGGTAFERGVRTAATKFSSINLMNQWTSGVKQLHAVVTQTRITDELLKGKYDTRLGQLGINEANSTAIAAQLKAHAKKIDKVWVANTKDWTSPELSIMWRAALRKESDRVIIIPGQEKPLFMDNELGKTIFQFKSFMFSATQRMLISSLQSQDKYMFQGMVGLISLGAMSYAFKQWDAGREITEDPKTLMIEGIDRSGALGILMEMNNTLEKVSSNAIGLRPLLGVSAPSSRYASRSALDSAIGPTFGLAGDIVKTMNAATNQNDWADSDTRALRRLIPGQNLSFMRQGFDTLEKEINAELK